MNYGKLPADPSALIFGTIASVIIVLGFCCGLLVFLSLIIGIIGLILSIKSLKEYELNPTNYSRQTYQNVYVAKIVCLVATILSSLYFIVVLVMVAIYQVSLLDAFKNKIEEKKNQEINDSILRYKQNYQNNSLYIDSTDVDSLYN
ncbi:MULTISPECIES: hypothetical protein [Flavobacterium]|uniref:DUF4190 domain-containing protein n=1 Tax=Flavobacterium hankyongi TaxID=1176532 RepID=A0ABP8ZM23_9FLAO|nr:hypothetical protein [Flavobacterium sp. N1846]